ncbi:hypothetical protein [Streptomyces albipurpureus]|uniref:DUF4316 domain-containing protein n=1 Tax=Streptomyces albipurpureus TaxID=2897419 RepID=A0ABT0UW75_9ACTN|nr:hypothetical protein [Streptomyces sp. CWNU-1]MCM2392699.1 hypothetical protein [Streptomyces sp. CWNU-1]
MRTAGLTMNDAWAHRVLRERGVETYRLEGVTAELGVMVESIELRHRSKEENYRPYLHMTGELRSVTPAKALPLGISQVTYSLGQGEKVDAFYEFDDQQLAVLVSKGYFTSGFAVPEQVTGIEWELPATADMLVLAPSGAQTEGDAPVVFTQVHRIGGLEIDLESSGYDLAGYFADHPRNGVPRTETVVDARGLKERSDAINTLFTEDELGLDTDVEQIVGTPVPEVAPVDAGMSARLQQIEAEIAAEREQYQTERASTEGTTENLYRKRVAAPLRSAEAQQEMQLAPPVQVREAQRVRNMDLDLELEEREQETRRREAGPVPSMDKRKRQVAQHAADLDLGEDDGEQSLSS